MMGVDSGRRDPWRPVSAGRGEALRPADGSSRSPYRRGPPCRSGARAGPAGLTADFGASPEGVMTMISTLTAAGTPARNALPPTTGPRGTGPLSSGPQGTGPLSAGSANTGQAGLGQGTAAAGPLPMPRSVPGAALSLLRTARQGLAEAEAEADAGTRYIGGALA